MNIRTLLLGTTVALGAVAATASAAPLSLPNGPLVIQFSNIEQISPTNAINPGARAGGCLANPAACAPTGTEGNWGVFRVNGIFVGDAVGTVPHVTIAAGDGIFQNTSTSDQYTGIFYGVENTIGAVDSQGNPTLLLGRGGFIDLYYREAPVGADRVNSDDLIGNTFTPADRTDQAHAGEFTDGILLVRLQFASGIDPSNENVHIRGTFDPGSFPGGGQAESFANVVDINGDGIIDENDGLWAAALNTDWFDTVFGTRDVRFENQTTALNNPAWLSDEVVAATSTDPAMAFAIPEPMTLASMGLGLLGIGLLARRRR